MGKVLVIMVKFRESVFDISILSLPAQLVGGGLGTSILGSIRRKEKENVVECSF